MGLSSLGKINRGENMNRCEFCGEENADKVKYCKKCGGLFIKPSNNVIKRKSEKISEESKGRKLFGYRSNNLIKMIIATFGYFIIIMLLIEFLFSNWNIPVGCSVKDIILDKTSQLLSFLIVISPAILFSDYEISKKTRMIVPLIKNGEIKSYVLFYFIVIIILGSINSIIYTNYSNQYIKYNTNTLETEKLSN
jgi:ribosomal protein L37E